MDFTSQHALLMLLIVGVFGMLLWGKIRYDIVAFAALLFGILIGVIPYAVGFSGFSHPATIIIALVLVVSRGLANSGAVELIGRLLSQQTKRVTLHIGLMSTLGAALSAVMNNVAALALLMPVDSEAARKAARSPALTLMPLSFATILGGMMTLIGTPPNIIVATIREDSFGESFGMFDYLAVGGLVAIVGIAYITFVGWRLLPANATNRNARKELTNLAGYIVEARITQSSSYIGLKLNQMFPSADEHDVTVLGLIRKGKRISGGARNAHIEEGDIVVIEGAASNTESFVGEVGLDFTNTKPGFEILGEPQQLIEVVVSDGSRILGRSALDIRLAYRQGVMLLGISRQGKPFRERVRRLKTRVGDVLLIMGPEDRLNTAISWLGCLPLANRGLRIIQRHKTWLAIGIFILAIGAASLGLVQLSVALGCVAVLYIVFGLVGLRELYESIEWPVIVLVASLIPIGAALDSSGAATIIATAVVSAVGDQSPYVILLGLMVITMTLSDILNNVATALIAAPIAVDIALGLQVNPDPFLMAVAVAASCAFLTPIGHKNNMIIMGPSGYRFGDYWRVGLPLEVLVILVGLPAITIFWPLY